MGAGLKPAPPEFQYHDLFFVLSLNLGPQAGIFLKS
jgi:hypothetical protein